MGHLAPGDSPPSNGWPTTEGTSASSAFRLVTKSLRSVTSSLAQGISAGYESLVAEQSDRDKVERVSFAVLEWPANGAQLGDVQGACHQQHVLVATYGNGWQLWDVGGDLRGGGAVREVLSRRDGPVRCELLSPVRCKRVGASGGVHCEGQVPLVGPDTVARRRGGRLAC